MKNISYTNIYLSLLVVSMFTLIVGSAASPFLDSIHSHENAAVETLQNFALLAGAIASLFFAIDSDKPERSTWYLSAAIFVVLLGREISWGATLLPLLSPEHYTQIPSSKVLWYRPYIAPVLSLSLTVLIAYFIRSKGWQFTKQAMTWEKLPVLEGGLFIISAVLTTAAEGKMGLSLPFSYNTNQNIEEIAELAAYLFLFTAAFRVKATVAPVIPQYSY